MLRESLIPKLDKGRIEFLNKMILEIESKIENENVDALIEAFHKETGMTAYDHSYFESFHSFQSSLEFATIASLGNPPKVTDLTNEELLWIISAIREASDFHDYYLDFLQLNVEYPNVSDLIYWPNELGYEDNLTSQDILNIILNVNNQENK